MIKEEEEEENDNEDLEEFTRNKESRQIERRLKKLK